jgi:hypothetical protein
VELRAIHNLAQVANRSIALQQAPERAGSTYYDTANGEHDMETPTPSIVVKNS